MYLHISFPFVYSVQSDEYAHLWSWTCSTTCGTLEYYNKTYDRVTPKVTFQFPGVTNLELHSVRRDIILCLEFERLYLKNFLTDIVLADREAVGEVRK